MTGKLEQVIIERRQHLCLADKMRLMAQTLRTFKGKQCMGKFYEKTNDSFCAYGALGFASGIPKDDLRKADFIKVYRNYGMDLDESCQVVDFPRDPSGGYGQYPEKDVSLFQAISLLNDRGYGFKEIATYLDTWADNLQS